MMGKNRSHRVLALITAVLISCSVLTYPLQQGSTQATDTPQVFLPLISTPDVCTPTLFRPLPPTIQAELTPQPPDNPENEIFASLTGSTYYAAVNGSSGGDGSLARPWDLDSALENTAQIKPGDTLLVRGGTYIPVKEYRKYNIKLAGNASQNVLIRAYPGERVTIDGGVEIYGSNVVFWGFEITNSETDRVADNPGSTPNDLRRAGGLAVYAPDVKLINNVVHEGAGGITAFSEALNALIYGNLSYNNGWSGPDRGHGHGLYAQNDSGTKYIAENIIFNNFGAYSFHIYREGGPLNNFELIGNVAINNTFLVGGLQPANNINLHENHVYNTVTRLGYSSQQNGQLSLVGNRLWNAGAPSLEVKWWNRVTLRNNCIFNNHSTAVLLQYPGSYNPYDWNANEYLVNSSAPFSINNSARTWSQWRSITGYDAGSILERSQPSKNEIFVRPNVYESKRGNIIIYNWEGADAVQVDISRLGLTVGESYVLHNAQNYFNETISGVYDGQSINVPMTGWSVAIPVGWDRPLGANTFPLFGVFVLAKN